MNVERTASGEGAPGQVTRIAEELACHPARAKRFEEEYLR